MNSQYGFISIHGTTFLSQIMSLKRAQRTIFIICSNSLTAVRKCFQVLVLRARSHGAIFCECDSIFLSHAMDCVDVTDNVHMVQLRWIFVCNITHEWVPHSLCVIVMCDSKYTCIHMYLHTSRSRTV